jgi:hypothetical protein
MNQQLHQLKIETLVPGKRYKLAESSSTGNLSIYNDDLVSQLAESSSTARASNFFIFNGDLVSPSPLSPAFPIGSLYVGDIVVFLNKVKLASGYYATRVLTITGEIGWFMCGHSLEEV